MNITRHFQSYAPRAFNPLLWLTTAKCRAIRLEIVAFSLLLMPVILVMADHLPFVDVPSSAFYHDAVSAVYGARITTGTTPTTFSPEDFVTRGQMAVFLHRGLGRVAYTSGNSLGLSSISQEMARLTINTGGAAFGYGFLKVDAAFSAININMTACPCEIEFYLSADSGATSQTPRFTLYDASPSVTITSASGAVTWVSREDTGNLTRNVRLFARIFNSEGDVPPNFIRGTGAISAIWVPFGATGGDTLSAASAEQGEAPPGTEPDRKSDTER